MFVANIGAHESSRSRHCNRVYDIRQITCHWSLFTLTFSTLGTPANFKVSFMNKAIVLSSCLTDVCFDITPILGSSSSSSSNNDRQWHLGYSLGEKRHASNASASLLFSVRMDRMRTTKRKENKERERKRKRKSERYHIVLLLLQFDQIQHRLAVPLLACNVEQNEPAIF